MAVRVLDVVYEHEEPEIDIVAVHGLGSTGDGAWTWKSPSNPYHKVEWLRSEEMLPKYVPKSRILVFDFASKWTGNAPKQRLSLIGQELLEALDQFRNHGMAVRQRPLLFLGHSFGGIVIEQALVISDTANSPYEHILKSVVGVIFLGTPHRGTRSQYLATILANFFSAVGYGSHTEILVDLAENSPKLRDLLQSFCLIANRLRIHIFCFFELIDSDFIGKLGLPFIRYRETVVDEQSACIDCFGRRGLNVDHFKLNKFSGPDDRNFCYVANEIQRIVSQTRNLVKLRLNPIDMNQDRSDFYTQYPGGKHFIQKLVLTDPVLDKTEIQRKKGGVVDGTCRWILKTKEYAMWLNGIAEPYTELQSRLLWLNGDPGRGKTYLACFVIDEISTFIKSSDGSLLIYFFCDANNEKRNTATSVLRGLILQLLRQCPRLFSYLSVQYEEQGEKLTSSFDALWTSFLKMVQDFGIKCTYCIIDGLDELNYHARSTILTAFTDAVEPSQHHEKAEAGGFLRVLMTSRPNPDIEEHLLPYASLSLRSEPASFIDIEIFIASKMKILKERKRYPPSTANFITEELKSKAEGTFLWVALTCEELNKVSSVEARKTIKNIPAGLPAVYRSILDQIKEENLSIVKRILGWVFVAFRPLLVEELHVACKVAEELGDGDDEIQFTIDCIGFCGSLVSIQSTESGDTVQLIHQSAHQYLTKIVSPDDHLYVDIPKMHAEMGNRCLEKINEYFSPGPPSSKTFLDYAARYVMHHAREAGNIPDGFNVLNPFFDKESTVCRAWLQYQQKLEGFVDSRTLTGFSPLHIASRWGVISLAMHLLSGDEESCIELLSQRDGYDATPLYYAAEKSYFDIAQLFINRGADVHARGGDFDTILQAAAVGGHEGILKLLLDHNVKIDEAGGRYCCALQAAAVEGHGKIVNILLQAGADVNSPRGGLFNNPLQAAAAGGYLEIVKVLLEKGANVNLEGGRYVTALQAASAQGHATVVGYLLENKAYIHGDRDSNQWSPNSYPLSEFANNDSHHGTALHEAACRGHLQIVKILVQSGADIEAIDAYYGNSLHAAATGGNIRIVEFLAERIKDINLESGHYGFALQAAASLGHFEAVKLLVSNGADPNSVGGHYVTASKAAQRGGYIDIRNFLEGLESRSR